MRTYYNDKILKDKIGETVTVVGWINSIRDHGGVYFIDLRDKTGLLQIVANPKSLSKDEYDKFHALRDEWVIQVSGLVRARGEGLENPNLKTGNIELVAADVLILSKSKTLPFDLTDKKVGVDIRNKYRYLELRDHRNLELFKRRSNTSHAIRTLLIENGFIDVNTPILTKSTPEGARDYLVPSRTHQGDFFALPQSPQLFKQMLMVAGFDKYFQFATCFRDEDLRADRQPEFTQIDSEMSFVNSNDITTIVNKIFKTSLEANKIGIEDINANTKKIEDYLLSLDIEVLHDQLEMQIPKISYVAAMDNFGSDKPDLRFGMELIDTTSIFANSGFEAFATIASDSNNVIKAVVAKDADLGILSKKDIKDLEKFVSKFGAKGLAYFQVKQDDAGRLELKGPLSKFLNYGELNEIIVQCDLDVGDIVFFGAGERSIVLDYMGRLRLRLAELLNEKQETFEMLTWAPLFVIDFPMFENKEDGSLTAMHHPFTAPKTEDWEQYKIGKINKDMINTDSYDLVLNGVEVGGGSIRIHDYEMQKEIFELLELSDEEINNKFGWFVESLQYGTPPHGGFAFGFDRLVALLNNKESIRDVIAFPKTQQAACPITMAPSDVSSEQLKDLSIRIRKVEK